MNKAMKNQDDEMRPEYDLRGGVRGTPAAKKPETRARRIDGAVRMFCHTTKRAQ
jgi:hypothetical protein